MLFLQIVVWTVSFLALVLYVIPRLAVLFYSRRIPRGNPNKGLVIFAESIRWLNIAWGLATFARGLRRAGYEGDFLYWRWHKTWQAFLLLPALMDTRLHEREARRLAEFIVEQRRQHPDRPICLAGYSAGGYIAVRALEFLPAEAQVDSALLLAAAVSPRRDLREAARAVRGKLVICSSVLDVVVTLGTLLFGTCDRKFTPSLGAWGYRGPPCENIVQIRWRPGRIRQGWFGDHFTAPAERFVATCAAHELNVPPK